MTTTGFRQAKTQAHQLERSPRFEYLKSYSHTLRVAFLKNPSLSSLSLQPPLALPPSCPILEHPAYLISPREIFSDNLS